MNKKKTILTIISIIFILGCCCRIVGFKTDVANDAKIIRTSYAEGMNGKTYIIETKTELNEYVKTNMEKYGLHHREKVYVDTTIGFVDAIEKYDEEFFKENHLVLILTTEGSGSIRH